MDRRVLQESIAQNKHFTASRKVSLYSNFSRLEDTNPDGYEANIAAWKEVLEDALRLGAFADSTCIEAGSELVAGLRDAQNGTPLSLHSVIDRMVEEGTLVPLSEFRRIYPVTPRRGVLARSSSMVGWAFNALLSRNSWSSKDAKGDGAALRKEKYVDIRAVTRGCRDVIDALKASAANQGNTALAKTFSEAQVHDLFPDKYSKLDLECYLAYAASKHWVQFNKELDVIKLVDAGPISDVDSTVTKLRSQILELTKREQAIASNIKECELKARDAVGSNRKVAKSFLQKKQGLEKSLDTTIAALDQLETMLQKIDSASDNRQAYDALLSSSKILNELNKGLSVDDVDDLKDHLFEAAADTDEVTSSLAELNLGKTAVDRELDDLELDKEMEQMEQEEISKTVDERLPVVPKHKPVIPQELQNADKRGQSRSRTPQESLAI